MAFLIPVAEGLATAYEVFLGAETAVAATEGILGAGELIASVGATEGIGAVGSIEAAEGIAGATSGLIASETVEGGTSLIINQVGQNALRGTALNTSLEASEGLVGNVIEDIAVNTSSDLAAIGETNGMLAEGVASSEAVTEDILGTSTGIDIVEDEIIQTEVLDATAETLLESFEAKLAEYGITREGVGSYTWQEITIGLSTGTIGIDEVIKRFDTGLATTINDTLEAIKDSKDGVGDLSNLFLISPTGDIVNANEVLQGTYTYVDPYYFGYTSGKLTVQTAFNNAKSSNTRPDKKWIIGTIMSINKNPKEAFIAKKLNQYLLNSDVIQDPSKYLTVYNAIYEIYDGNYIKEPYINEEGKIEAIDEVGDKVVYNGPEGTHELFGIEFNNPSIHGNFVGPESPRNALPIDNFDTISFLHSSNTYGTNNNHLEDLKMAARLQHLLNNEEYVAKLDSTTQELMRFQLLWALKIMPMINAVVNNSNDDVGIREFLQSDANDFYQLLLGRYDNEKLGEEKQQYQNKFYWTQRKIRNEGRNFFYAGFNEGVEEEYKYQLELFMKNQAILKLVESSEIIV